MKAVRAERLLQRQQRKDEFVRQEKLRKTADWKKKRKACVRKEQIKKEKKKLAASERRQKIKNDPDLHAAAKAKERERWKRRVREGKVKKVKDMTETEQRKVRRMRRQSVRRHREKKKAENTSNNYDINEGCKDNDPDNPPAVTVEACGSNFNRASVGRKRKKAGRSACYRSNKRLKQEIEILQRKVWRDDKAKLRKKQKKQKTKNLTPQSKVNKLVSGKFVGKNIKRKLVFGEVLASELAERNKSAGLKVKHVLNGPLASKYLRKYRMMHMAYGVMSQRIIRKIDSQSENGSKSIVRSPWKSAIKRRNQVVNFFERDSVSTVCPGKKDFITKKKVKKGKRFLCGTLSDLYKAFKSEEQHEKLSYALFCRLKPFWVVERKVTGRDTCLCGYCENTNLLVKALHSAKALEASTSSQLISSLCCDDSHGEVCLQRSCDECKGKEIIFSSENCDTDAEVKRFKWVSINEVIDGRTVKRTIKQEFNQKLSALQEELKSSINSHLLHKFRAKHQYNTIREIVDKLSPGELLIHVDFSENYQCKYFREVQSAYYGASKQSIVLHQGMAYAGNGKKQAFLTLSSYKKKDPAAIMAHICKVLDWLLPQLPPTTTLHIASDSPSNQYRNRENFFAVTRLLPERYPQLINILYHFTEAGHGKSTADGVGSWGKNATDEAVSNGEDITDCHSMAECLKKKAVKTHVDVVKEDDVSHFRAKIPKNINKFKGTNKVHYFSWNKENKNHIYFATVSCTSCSPGTPCSHFGLPGCPWNPHGMQPPRPPNKIQEKRKATDDVKVGDWVAVAFHSHWYPGVVEKVTARTQRVNVNFLVRHVKSDKLFLWPQKQDMQGVKKDAILFKLSSPPVPITRVLFSIPEQDKIDRLMKL